MHLPKLAAFLLDQLLARVAITREPDFIVGADSPGGPYLRRWYLTPWRRLQTRLRERAQASPTRRNRTAASVIGWMPNLYLHQFLRDDDDRALHDHPSWAASFILEGCYIEHTIAAGGIHSLNVFRAGSLRFLPTRHAHRIELDHALFLKGNAYDENGDYLGTDYRRGPKLPCWTLFLFGPTVRNWGFHCPDSGWIPWQQFTAVNKPGEVGPGCDA